MKATKPYDLYLIRNCQILLREIAQTSRNKCLIQCHRNKSDVRYATHLRVHSEASRSASRLSRRVSPQLRPHTTEGSRRRRTKKSSESPSTISGREKNVLDKHIHVRQTRPSTAEGTVGQHSKNSLAAGYSVRDFYRKQKLLTEPEELFKPAYFSSFDYINQTLKTGDHVWIKVDVHGGAYVHTVASLGQFRGTNGLKQSEADVRAMKDVPFVLDGFVKGRFVDGYKEK